MARLAAPAIAAAATAGAVSAAVSALRERGLLTPRRTGHVVVCGLGRKGWHLAASVEQDHSGVVVIEREREVVETRRHRSPRLTVVHGDATDVNVLRHAGVPRARALYALTGSDGTNATIAMAVRRLARRPGLPLDVFVHVVDAELEHLLAPWLENVEGPCAIRLVNIYEAAARALLARHRPVDAGGGAVVVVVGAGRLGQSLVVELGRVAVAAGSTAAVVLVDREATLRTAALRARNPSFEGSWQLFAHDVDVTDPCFETPGYLADLTGGAPIAGVYVLLGDEELAVVTALTVARNQRAPTGLHPIVVRVGSREHGLGRLFAEDVARPPEYASITAFDVLAETCHPDLVEAVARDRRAGRP